MTRLLGFVVVIAPTIFALGIEVIDKRTRETARWRVGIFVFGVALSGLTLWQQTSERRASAKERERAIKETSQKVAAETSEQVTKAVTEQYSQMVADQKTRITDLQNKLAAQAKDLSAIKGSNIVTGKNPVKVEVINPNLLVDKDKREHLPGLNWTQEDLPADPATGHAQKMIRFAVEEALDVPAFLAVCDRPCKPKVGAASGMSKARLLTVGADPTAAGLLYELPRPMAARLPCLFQLESADDKPVKVMSFRIMYESELPLSLR